MTPKTHLTISGNLKVRVRVIESEKLAKYDIVMGRIPLLQYLIPLFKGGEYTQIYLERKDHRRYDVQGNLDLFNKVTDKSLYKNGNQIKKDIDQQVEVHLNNIPLEISLGERFEDLETGEWQEHGYCKCEVKILRRSNVS